LVRAAIDAGCVVTCVPGPFAAVSALAISGLPTHAFRFVGFLPRRAGERLRRLEALALDPDTIVLYESPHRLVSTLRDAVAAFGPDRQIAVGRELTKKFEEVVRAPLGEALQHFEQNPPRGEFTLVVAGTGYRGNEREPEGGPNAEAALPGRRQARGRRSTRSGNERRRGAQLV
jgi:16S rRNA (cytidine1402-2'-O)-methyltransferase